MTQHVISIRRQIRREQCKLHSKLTEQMLSEGHQWSHYLTTNDQLPQLMKASGQWKDWQPNHLDVPTNIIATHFLHTLIHHLDIHNALKKCTRNHVICTQVDW